jgi:hypothetical protein
MEPSAALAGRTAPVYGRGENGAIFRPVMTTFLRLAVRKMAAQQMAFKKGAGLWRIWKQ